MAYPRSRDVTAPNRAHRAPGAGSTRAGETVPGALDAQGVEGKRKSLLGVTPRTPVVAGPEPEPRIQGGSDYEDIGVSVDVRADHVACDCLVRNHEQSACDVSGQRSSFHSLMLRTLVVARESGLCRGCECGKSSCVFPPPETRAILRA